MTGAKAPELLLSRTHATMQHPLHRGASPRDATVTIPRRNQGSLIAASANPGQPCPPCLPLVPRGHGVRGAIRPWGQPPFSRARKREARAESPDQVRSVLYSGGRANWKRQPLSQAGFRARKLLLSRISISLAAESMRSMGALITASTNPLQPCPIPPPRGASPRKMADITPSWIQAPRWLLSRILPSKGYYCSTHCPLEGIHPTRLINSISNIRPNFH